MTHLFKNFSLSIALLLGLLATSIASPLTASSSLNPAPSVLMVTSVGDIMIQLFPETAPQTVANFLAIAYGPAAGWGYYNDCLFTVDSVAGTLTIANAVKTTPTTHAIQSIWGGTFNDELNATTQQNLLPYLLFMDNGGTANNNASGFIISISGNSQTLNTNTNTAFGYIADAASQAHVQALMIATTPTIISTTVYI